MGKVTAPRPTPRIVKIAPSEAQLEVRRSLRWQQANTAAQEFLAAAKDAHDSLINFSPVTEEHIDWLKEAIGVAIEYLDELNRFGTHQEANKFFSDHRLDQAEHIATLLRSIITYNEDSLDFESSDISEQIKRNISELAHEKMEAIERAGWNMYKAFLLAN